MAKILGKSGRYVLDEAIQARRKIILTVCIVIGILGTLEGIIISTLFPLSWLTPLGKSIIVLLVAIAIWAADRWGTKRIAAAERKQKNMDRGATGEIRVGTLLAGLPDDFCVINDPRILAKSYRGLLFCRDSSFCAGISLSSVRLLLPECIYEQRIQTQIWLADFWVEIR